MNIIKKILNYELYKIDEDEPLWKSALVWTAYLILFGLLWVLIYIAGGR